MCLATGVLVAEIIIKQLNTALIFVVYGDAVQKKVISISDLKCVRLVGEGNLRINLFISAPEYYSKWTLWISFCLNTFEWSISRAHITLVKFYAQNYIMKIIWFVVIIVLLVNFTLIESARVWSTASFRRRPSLYVRRRFYRPKSTSIYRNYGSWTSEDKSKTKTLVDVPPRPDHSLLMNNPKRLNYLASVKNKETKSNVGRILSGG